MTRDRIFQTINLERQRQITKWGEQHYDNYTWLAILTEEVGESAQAALHDMFGGQAAGTLGDELVQAAAVIVAWLEDKEEGKVDDSAWRKQMDGRGPLAIRFDAFRRWFNPILRRTLGWELFRMCDDGKTIGVGVRRWQR